MGAILGMRKIPKAAAGKWSDTISTANLSPGIYYLRILLDGRVEHLQELIIQ